MKKLLAILALILSLSAPVHALDWNINGNIFTTTAQQDEGLLWYMMASITVHATGAGGTGYTVGNVLTATGGTFTEAATFTVTAVGPLGECQAVKIRTKGDYTVLPIGAIQTTVDAGAGTGCRLRLPATNYNTLAEKLIKDFGLSERDNWRAAQNEVLRKAQAAGTNAQKRQAANVYGAVLP